MANWTFHGDYTYRNFKLVKWSSTHEKPFTKNCMHENVIFTELLDYKHLLPMTKGNS